MDFKIDFINENFKKNYTIKGKLTNYTLYPINNVLIVLNDLNNKVKITTLSNDNGNFEFKNLDKSSKFELYFFKNGLKNKKIHNLFFKECNIININLKYKDTLKFSCLSGSIFDEIENVSIKNIKVELFKLNSCSIYPICITKTNKFGKFKIDCLTPGSYFLKLTSPNYKTKYYNLRVYNYNDFLNFKIFLKPLCKNYSTIIYGKITNNLGEAIDSADVILYKKINKNIIPILFTKTNKNGYYFFKNVPLGTYLIKSIKHY